MHQHLAKNGMITHYLCWFCMLILQAWVVKGQIAHIADADVSCQCLLTEVCLAQPISAAHMLPVYTMTSTTQAFALCLLHDFVASGIRLTLTLAHAGSWR